MPAKTANDLSAAARLFHALADETRLRILDCLLDCEQCVCDLTEELRAGQSRLSFHLKTLKDAGLIRDRREGRWVYYSLNPDALGEIQELMGMWKMRGLCRTAKCAD
jgi:ArsR family transcriptional regulator